MNCPTCPDSTLILHARHGVEIDHCPRCRGVWLDRGELDKIIDRSTHERHRHDDDDDADHHPDSRSSPGRHPHAGSGDSARDKRRPWWTELFD